MARRNKHRGSSVKRGSLIEVYGMSELLQKIERAGGNVNAAVKKCVDRSLEQVAMKMQIFMIEHRFTGETKDSYEFVPAVITGNTVNGIVGYDVKKGGLPAIFLDVGTPTQKPYFFRYYAVENSNAQIRMIQKETLEEILGGLM